MCRDGEGHVGMRTGPGVLSDMCWENISLYVCVLVWCVHLILRLLKMSKREENVNGSLSEKSCFFPQLFQPSVGYQLQTNLSNTPHLQISEKGGYGQGVHGAERNLPLTLCSCVSGFAGTPHISSIHSTASSKTLKEDRKKASVKTEPHGLIVFYHKRPAFMKRKLKPIVRRIFSKESCVGRKFCPWRLARLLDEGLQLPSDKWGNADMHFLSGLDKCIPSLETDPVTQPGRNDYNTVSPGITRKAASPGRKENKHQVLILLKSGLLVYPSFLYTEPTPGRQARPWEPQREVQSPPSPWAFLWYP